MSADGVLRRVDVAIVGGGAAGLATGIFLGRSAGGESVVVLDGAKKLGAKILVSGGGRCNVTNRVVRASDFCGGSRNVIKRVLAAFSAERTIEFFREIGVELHEEEHGKMFPNSNRAQDVLEGLLREATRWGVDVLAERRVSDVVASDEGFRVVTEAETWLADRVVLATGGRSLPKTGSDGGGYSLARGLGHSMVPVTPALAPLVLEGDFHAGLSGVSQDVELAVRGGAMKPVRLRGSMLWTHFGVSGPVVLNASRYWEHGRLDGNDVSVSVNFFPGFDFVGVERELLVSASGGLADGRETLRRRLGRLLPVRVVDGVLGVFGIDGGVAMGRLSRDARRRLVHGLVGWRLPVRESRGYRYAEVTAGGVPLGEVDASSLGSRKCAGLSLVGEILDVDGRIGGFNFQWAWSSAFVAAMGIGRCG